MRVWKMHGLIRDEDSFGANPGMKDLARHLRTRMVYGKVVVVTDKPTLVVSSLRKQWLKLVQKTHLEFTLDYPPDEYPGDVYVATIEQLLLWPPQCRTMYITCDVELENLHMITAWMPKGSLVAICKLSLGAREG